MREALRTLLDRLPTPLVRTGAWLCVALLGVLSWLPASMEKRTGLPGQVEHIFAYACTAAALTLGYRPSPRWRLMAGLVAYAAVLEVGQLYVPGRHAAVIDWAASSLGAVLGVFAMASLMWPAPRRTPLPGSRFALGEVRSSGFAPGANSAVRSEPDGNKA